MFALLSNREVWEDEGGIVVIVEGTNYIEMLVLYVKYTSASRTVVIVEAQPNC